MSVLHTCEHMFRSPSSRSGGVAYSRLKLLLVFLCFVLRLLFFLYQWGLVPEWVKPAAKGGGLFLLFLAFYVSLFSTMLSYCFILRACILSTQPSWLTDVKRD
jgi:hypothetical protein